MARVAIVVERWVVSLGWQYDKGFPNEELALDRGATLEGERIPVRIYRRTPEGPEIIYESPRP